MEPTKDLREEGDTAKDRPTERPSKVPEAPTAYTRYETDAGKTRVNFSGSRTEETAVWREQVILGDARRETRTKLYGPVRKSISSGCYAIYLGLYK